MLSPADPGNHVLDGGPDLPWERAILRGMGMPDMSDDILP